MTLNTIFLLKINFFEPNNVVSNLFFLIIKIIKKLSGKTRIQSQKN